MVKWWLFPWAAMYCLSRCLFSENQQQCLFMGTEVVSDHQLVLPCWSQGSLSQPFFSLLWSADVVTRLELNQRTCSWGLPASTHRAACCPCVWPLCWFGGWFGEHVLPLGGVCSSTLSCFPLPSLPLSLLVPQSRGGLMTPQTRSCSHPRPESVLLGRRLSVLLLCFISTILWDSKCRLHAY